MNLLEEKKLTVKQAATVTGLTIFQLYDLINTGKLPHIRINEWKILLLESDLKHLLENNYHRKKQERAF